MFRKNRPKLGALPAHNGDSHTEPNSVTKSPIPAPVTPVTRTMLQFYCQLAHGSPTVFVSGFSSVKELYQKIGESFDFPSSEVKIIIIFFMRFIVIVQLGEPIQ